MRKYNPENELAKREYLAFLRNAGGRSAPTLDAVAAAIHRFEAFNRYKPFKSFRREQAISFKQHLAAQTNPSTGKPLSKATLYSTLKALRAFFEWLAREPGYRRALVYSDAAYFNVTDNEMRVATARRERPTPSLEQVRRIVQVMPADTVVQRRDRAVVALIMLTGARDSAAASLKLKHLDLANRTLFQDARDVKTKRAKTSTTTFFPVGEPFETLVREWARELARDHGLGPDDPLFPATRVGVGEAGVFGVQGLERRPWNGAGSIRKIFHGACAGADLPYFCPHGLRRTLMRLAYDLNLSPRELKAWSQNLGHESVLTSLGSYGTLSAHEQAEVMGAISAGGETSLDVRAALAILQAAIDPLKPSAAVSGPNC